jgi:methyltransferase OMS1
MAPSARHLIAGAGLYLAVAGSTYSWMKSKQQVKGGGSGNSADGNDADADALLGRLGPREASAATARRFDSLSRIYDDTVGAEERWMLTGLLRSRLLSSARGKVLEIGAGTGRNAPHYRWSQIDELTLVDASAYMLRRAERAFYDEQRVAYRHPHVKARFCLGDAEDLVAEAGEAPRAPPLPRVAEEEEEQQEVQGRRQAGRRRGRSGGEGGGGEEEEDGGGAFSRLWRKPTARAVAAATAADDAEETEEEERKRRPPPPPTPPPATPQTTTLAKFAPRSFDVVVDTFGLCSVGDPVRVLRQAARLAKPRREGGRVLLLEHGRPPPGGVWDWLLSGKMDAAAAEHKRRWGCWFNRDVAAIVRESGLEVLSESRWHFGTTYVYELAEAEDGGGSGDGET